MLQHTAPRHMAIGGSIFLGYDLIFDFMRHHDETNMRPMIVDHVLAMSIIGTVGGFMATNTIRGAFQGFLFFGLNLGFFTYWAMKMGRQPGSGQASAHIYYDTDVTKEEKERLEMQDQLEILTHNMLGKPAYGLVDINQTFEK